jgi:eukaryotic-like serine/threonine-protein kinase
MDWVPPQEFDGYRLLSPLGRGAMGQVYLGKDLLLERAVAIKFIAGKADESSRRQFLIEGRAIARLSHPNVVAVHRVSEVEGHPYLVYEYVRGQSLDLLPRPLRWQKVLEISIGLARGLAAAHRRGVLHRDIKPANAVLADDGNVKLLDFGIAEVGAPLGDSSTSEPQLLPPRIGPSPQGDGDSALSLETESIAPGRPVPGTPRYMAPELIAGESASRRTDLYALGVVLYELCAGTSPPRDDDQGSHPQLLKDVSGLHPRLAAIIDRCLDPEPLRRWASADEVLDALEQVAPTHRAVQLPAGNPYRGLRPFDAEHRALFFGRDHDIAAVVDRLRSDPLVVVAGDSGVGKSSLCRAGVLPLVAEGGLDSDRGWRVVRLIPGRDPVGQLAVSLAPAFHIEAEALRAWMHSEPAALARAFQHTRQEQPDLALLVFVDQAEELISLAPSEDAARFATCCGLTLDASPKLRWLLTVRGDMVTRLAAVPGLGQDLQHSLYILRPLAPERLRDAVVGPARTYGVSFESEAMVDALVEAGQPPKGSLPLLQFALSELWEARDMARGQIPSSALEAIGGVSGALARHADGVLVELLPAQRSEARRILLSLVSADGTRTRRAAGELALHHEAAARALNALVAGRLVVAREREGNTEYELAHESLARGWPTLSLWLDADAEGSRSRQRLLDAAAEWERLGRSRDALWHGRQLLEVQEINPGSLGDRERNFLLASRQDWRRQRLLWVALGIGVLLLVALGSFASYTRSRAPLRAQAAAHHRQAADALREGRAAVKAAAAKREEAFRLFDGTWRQPASAPVPADVRWEEAEALWMESVGLETRATSDFTRATLALESSLLLDPERSSFRSDFAEVLLEQLAQSRANRPPLTQAVRERLLSLDLDGRIRRKLEAPGVLALQVVPEPAGIGLERYELDGQVLRPRPAAVPDLGPRTQLSLTPGSYRLALALGDGITIYFPFLVRPGERTELVVRLPPAGSVPQGFVYVPAGRFLVGSGDDEGLRAAQTAAPMHEVQTEAFLISASEVTFAEWIEYLEAAGTRAREHAPNVESTKGVVRLNRSADGWSLYLRPTSKAYIARWGQPISYEGRSRLATQDWRRFPVSGISLVDMNEYLRWLSISGRVPGARLCTDWEWERAARGADGRPFTTGPSLPANSANVDVTYGRVSAAFGPDEVGSHPESDSPFGLHDMAGNALEVVAARRPDEAAAGRGGSWYFDIPLSARTTSHEPLEPQTRAVYLGFRVCAPVPTLR